MKIIDYFNNSDKTLFSYEIIPPFRGGSLQKVFELVEQLMPFNPPFIDLTAASTTFIGESKSGSPSSKCKTFFPFLSSS